MIRVGHGFDVHKLTEGRKLILCGVEIPYEKGLLGHSDADVALHALMDAILGAAALGDIGTHFPDTDDEFKGADSQELLERVMVLVEDVGYIWAMRISQSLRRRRSSRRIWNRCAKMSARFAAWTAAKSM